ncbi:MAG TPA: hypothetical protein PKW80_13035 [Bacteroidales bacterium]|nr:hypothetical protein [Bacteroidales bacterium]
MNFRIRYSVRSYKLRTTSNKVVDIPISSVAEFPEATVSFAAFEGLRQRLGFFPLGG